MDKPRLDLLVDKVARLCGTSCKAMRSASRDNHVFEARLVLAAVAMHYGFRRYEIAWGLDKHKTMGGYYERSARLKAQAEPRFSDKINKTIKSIEKWKQEILTNI